MATDFWASSHYKRWIVDRATLKQARVDDLQYVDDPQYLDLLAIFFANVISKLGKKLQLRQRVIATATVFFRRFYLKNSYCETDPFIVIAACCYVAAKAEESPVHIKNVVAEARLLFSHESYGIKHFPSDNSKLAEMEFYLVDDLECDLTVFHPYRTLLTLCRKEGSVSTPEDQTEAGEVGVGIGEDEGPRYWGSGDGQLELQEGGLQTAWFIINDTYRSELCLLYPPHLIAIAAVYLTLVLHTPTRDTLQLQKNQNTHQKTSSEALAPPAVQPRRSSRQSHTSLSSSTTPKKYTPTQDAVTFLAELNISMPLIATISQEIIGLYKVWERYKEDVNSAASGGNGNGSGANSGPGSAQGSSSPFGGSATSQKRTFSGVAIGTRSENTSLGGTPGDAPGVAETPREDEDGVGKVVTPQFLTTLLMKMRENRLADMAHPETGRPVAVNRLLERTQAAG